MKKTGILTVAMLFVVTAIFAQQGRPQQTREQIRQYIEKNVVPFLQSQREKLIASFNKDEKTELIKIQKDFETFKSQRQQMRGNMRRNCNTQMANGRKEGFDSILSRADALLTAHPNEVAAYKKALAPEKEKWLTDMEAMRPDFKNANKRPPFKQTLIDKIDNPSFALLWDGKEMPRQRMNNFKQGRGNRRGCAGIRRGAGMRDRVGNGGGNMPDRPNMRPETREKISAYAKQSIVPVVLSEQKSFETVLTKKEMKQIENARRQVLSRKGMFQSRRFSPNAPKGPPVDDSARLVMRIQMQKVMMPVQEIALKHYTEIEKHLKTIKSNFPQWRKEMMAIISENGGKSAPRQIPPPMRNAFKKLNSPMAFLLFNETLFDSFNARKK